MKLQDLLINDRGFAFDPSDGHSYQLSPTALCLVQLLKKGATEPELISKLVADYAVDEHTAARDISVFLQTLKDLVWL
jgi:hypothetical protein